MSRLIFAVVFSVIIILLDHKSTQMREVRQYLNTAISPIQWLANVPGQMLDWSSRRFVAYRHLVSENERLQQQNLVMSAAVQRYQLLKSENTQLRQLLGATERQDGSRMIAELMGVDNNPFSHQIVVNRGAFDNVYQGQPVLDQNGIVGHVQYVSTNTSRVLLLADISHNIPVRVLRNNLNAVLAGSGTLNNLSLRHITHSSDIQVGDILVSSGLGKRFPEGYPVAEISRVVKNQGSAFATIEARPVADLNRLKYLVLLWPDAVK